MNGKVEIKSIKAEPQVKSFGDLERIIEGLLKTDGPQDVKLGLRLALELINSLEAGLRGHIKKLEHHDFDEKGKQLKYCLGCEISKELRRVLEGEEPFSAEKRSRKTRVE